jgi:hypothetical protein
MDNPLRRLKDTDGHKPTFSRSASSMAVCCKGQRKVDRIVQCGGTPMYNFRRKVHMARSKAWDTWNEHSVLHKETGKGHMGTLHGKSGCSNGCMWYTVFHRSFGRHHDRFEVFRHPFSICICDNWMGTCVRTAENRHKRLDTNNLALDPAPNTASPRCVRTMERRLGQPSDRRYVLDLAQDNSPDSLRHGHKVAQNWRSGPCMVHMLHHIVADMHDHSLLTIWGKLRGRKLLDARPCCGIC